MQTIIVDMTPGFRMPTIYYSQGDVGTQFAIDLRSRFGDSFPAGTTVTIQATKPSGFGFSVAATSVTNGVATFTTTAEMTDEFGRFPAELKVTKTGLTLFTANFYMDGERNTHPEGTTDGSQETVIPELTQLVERVEDAASSVLDMTVVANTLPAGSDATYSYDEETNTATFGIPKGADGSLASGVLAPTYSSSSTYAVGDYVYYSGSLYRCTTAITTAEAWTSGHWTQVALAPEVSDLKSDLDVINGGTKVLTDGTKGGYYDSTGTLISNPSYYCVSLRAFNIYEVSVTLTKTLGLPIHIVLDESGNVLDYDNGGSSGASKNFLIPQNAAVILLNFYDKTYFSGIILKSKGLQPDETDKTLLVENKPADAKVVGDNFTDSKSGFDSYIDYDYAVANGGSVELSHGFEKGYWSDASTKSNGFSSIDVLVPNNLTSIDYTITANVLTVGYLLDENGSTVKTLGSGVGSYHYDITSNIHRLRINFFGSAYYSGITFNFDDVITENTQNIKQIQSDIMDGYDIGATTYTPTTYTGKFITAGGAVASNPNPDYIVHKYAVLANVPYCLHGSSKIGAASLPIASFSTSDIDQVFANTELIINNGTSDIQRYYEVYYMPPKDGYIYVAGYGSIPLLTVSDTKKRISGLSALKIQVFGDSITDDSWGSLKFSWASVFSKYMPLPITLKNDAVGGSMIVHSYTSGGKYNDKTDGNGVYDLITDGTMELDNNLIIIFAGTNDWKYPKHLGTWDGVGADDFIPALRKICEYVTSNTKSLLLVCTPINRYPTQDQSAPTDAKGAPLNTDNKTLRDYCDAILEVCNFYGVPVIDTNYNIGFTRENIDDFTIEGLHPNAEGSKILAKYIASEIKQHYGL